MSPHRLKVCPAEDKAIRIPGSPDREELLQALAISALRQPSTAAGEPSPSAVREIAHRLNVEQEAVYKMVEGVTISNPLLDLCAWIDGSRAAGKPVDHAVAAIFSYLERRYSPSTDSSPRAFTATCSHTLGSAAAVVQSVLEAIDATSPGGASLTEAELSDWRRQRLGLNRHLAELDAQVEAAARRGKAGAA
jgi:hypothetical protein